MNFARRFAVLMSLAIFLCAPSWSACAGADAAPAATVSYFRDVRPIFQVHCLGCHQPAKAMGDFVMTNFENLAKGGVVLLNLHA